MKRHDTHSKTTRATLAKHVAHTPSQTKRDIERSHGRQGIGRSPRDLDMALAEPLAGPEDLQKFIDVYPGQFAKDEPAFAFSNSALAIGPNAQATLLSAVALGGNTVAGANATAVGTLAEAVDSGSAVGMQSNASGTSSVAVGASSTASGSSSTAVGETSTASGTGSTAFGQRATATGNYSFAWGTGSQALGATTVVMGAGAVSNIGSSVDGEGNIVIGSAAAINGTGAGAIAVGRSAFISTGGPVTGVGSIVIGDRAGATADNAVAIGANALADKANTFSVGRPGGERTITNLAPGDINTPASTEAVNGGQLYGTLQRVISLEDTLTKSGLIDNTGASLAVTYYDGGKNLVVLGDGITPVKLTNVATAVVGTDAVNFDLLTTTVNEALSNVGGSLPYVRVQATTGVAKTNGENAVAIGSNADAGSANALAIGTGSSASVTGTGDGLLAPVAVGYNSVAREWSTFSVGRSGKERKIVNVAAGAAEEDSTDAVNGDQLWQLFNTFTARTNQMEAQWRAAMAAMQAEIQGLRRQLGAAPGR